MYVLKMPQYVFKVDIFFVIVMWAQFRIGKVIHVLGFFNQSYDFSRKSLSKYLMDTIDFNKHDIDIFINLAKTVRYGRFSFL
jgi:hypothetical protein